MSSVLLGFRTLRLPASAPLEYYFRHHKERDLLVDDMDDSVASDNIGQNNLSAVDKN